MAFFEKTKWIQSQYFIIWPNILLGLTTLSIAGKFMQLTFYFV